MQRINLTLVAGSVVLVAVLSACGGAAVKRTASGATAPPKPIAASDFDKHRFNRSTKIDNAWLPLRPGTQLVFEGTTSEGAKPVPHRLVFTVTDLVKTIGGIRTVVQWDRDFSGGKLVETELAFFAQDDGGNVWELGEFPAELKNGRVIDAPAWIHAVKRAKAGITMPADPRVGTPSYSLGWGPAVGFNDRAKVLRVGQRNCVPVGCFENGLVVDEYNPTEPEAHQLKYYARGIGNTRVSWSGTKEKSKEVLVLVAIRHLGRRAMADARAQAFKLERLAYRQSKDVYGRTRPLQRPR